MSFDQNNPSNSSDPIARTADNSFDVKVGLARMLCNGVIMDVIDVEQARIAEECGAIAVMALERVPSDIRRDGGVARMSDPQMIEDIKRAVSIPVMAKVRIGHIAEAQILEAIGIDFIDESEVLTPFSCRQAPLSHAVRVRSNEPRRGTPAHS